ncbi:MAG: hypothetical protein IKH78_04055 [Ruminococcus sp.]|nr:hypothetical protein [Ruminococcus sp.]
MAIRKDLDDMLNSLMDGGGGGSAPARSHTTPRAARKSRFDDMSVDDLLHALEDERRHMEEESHTSGGDDQSPPSVWEFAPPSENAAEPVKGSDLPEHEEIPNVIEEVMHTEASAEVTRVFDTIPPADEIPKPARKKKIVITGELPDYEALRREEFERERQAKLAAEAAREEARAAERARRAAEAAAERQRLAEEAEQRRRAQEEAEMQRRLAEEAEKARLAQEEAERQLRLAEEAEKARLAQEEAERQLRLAEEAEKARLAQEEAERQRRLEEEAERARLAQEEVERQRRLEKEAAERLRIAKEEAEKAFAPPVEESEQTAITGETAAGQPEAVQEVSGEISSETEKPKKLGFFKKLINKNKDEAREGEEAAAEELSAPEEGLFEAEDDSVSATDLINAAIAAINNEDDEDSSDSSDPVGNMLENIREDAAEAIADMEKPEEEPEAPARTAEPLIMSDDDIIAGLTPELKKRFDELSADKQRQVIEMRRAQMGAIAPPVVIDEPEEEPLPEELPEEEEISEEPVQPEEESSEEEKPDGEEQEQPAGKPEEPAAEKAPEKENKPKGPVTSALARILEEDPAELIAQRKEVVESSGEAAVPAADKKKKLFTVLGIIFTVFAVIGLIATILKGVGLVRSFTSGEVKKDGFTQMIYPAAIMDIEPFSDPSQLTSEQIVTATIWSVIMDDNKISKYPITMDMATIPAVDVEKYAVELFGENLPAFEHVTTGPPESRFYFADGAYNVKVKPVTHTYSPEIKSIVKNGSEYTLTVDYIAELPAWMEKTVAKQAEYKLTENEDGTFRYSSMKLISVNNGNL